MLSETATSIGAMLLLLMSCDAVVTALEHEPLRRRLVARLRDLRRALGKSRASEDRQDKQVARLESEVAQLEERERDLHTQLRAVRKAHEADTAKWEAERAELHQVLEWAEEEEKELKRALHAARSRLRALGERDGGLSDKQRDALCALAAEGIQTLADALQLLEILFGDRVVVLESAKKSAREAKGFKKPVKAWELMHRLVTNYWRAVQSGGDAAGRKCFSTTAFASGESETVRGRKGARQRRTFLYRGKPLTMDKHLKIGTKYSAAETWRCHFEFDAEERKIVIGHCGKHLNFK